MISRRSVHFLGMVPFLMITGCTEPKVRTHDLCCRIWMTEDLEWVAMQYEKTGSEYAANGSVLVLDSTGFYRRSIHMLYRDIGKDTVFFGAEGAQDWIGAWVREDSLILVCFRYTFNSYAPTDSGYPGPLLCDSLYVVEEVGGTRLRAASGEVFIPWEIFGERSRRNIEWRGRTDSIFIQASEQLRTL